MDPALAVRLELYSSALYEGSLGPGLARFPHCEPAKKAYLSERASGRVRGPMSSGEEEIYTMVSGLAVFAVFCIAALLWLG